METSDDGESTDGEDTAKQQKLVQPPHPHNKRDSPEWRSSLSQNRLSTLFDAWSNNTQSTSPKRVSTVFTSERVSVSEPKLVEHHTGSSGAGSGHGNFENSETEEPDSAEFEQMLVRLQYKFLFPNNLAHT
jgi:hypothetical protein